MFSRIVALVCQRSPLNGEFLSDVNTNGERQGSWCIPVTPAISLGGIDQPIDLGAGQGAPLSDRRRSVYVSVW
jgi:hypothetical protein